MANDRAKTVTSAVELVADIAAAWLSNPNVRVVEAEVPAFLHTLHATITTLSNARNDAAQPRAMHTPAVPAHSSVRRDYIVSLIDGRRYKSLKRHLLAHGLTPVEYRERYGLKPDYPMVAAGYSAKRSEIAKRIRFGSKPRVIDVAMNEPADIGDPSGALHAPADTET